MYYYFTNMSSLGFNGVIKCRLLNDIRASVCSGWMTCNEGIKGLEFRFGTSFHKALFKDSVKIWDVIS